MSQMKVSSETQKYIKSTGVDLSTPVDKHVINLSSIGKKVKEIREEAGLSQDALGRSIGKSKQAISKIENDDFSSVERIKSTLILIAKALKNNFGEEWLNGYLDENNVVPNKREIIQSTSVDEIFTLKFGGSNSQRSQSEMIKLKNKLDAEIAKMKEDEEKYEG